MRNAYSFFSALSEKMFDLDNRSSLHRCFVPQITCVLQIRNFWFFSPNAVAVYDGYRSGNKRDFYAVDLHHE